MMCIRTPAPDETFGIIVVVICLLGAFGWGYNIGWRSHGSSASSSPLSAQSSVTYKDYLQ
jgi:hypothetical protein